MNKKNKKTILQLIVNEIKKRYVKSIDFQENGLKAELEAESARDFISNYWYIVKLNGKQHLLCDDELEKIKYETVYDMFRIKAIRISDNEIELTICCSYNEKHYKYYKIMGEDLDKPILNLFLEKGIL